MEYLKELCENLLRTWSLSLINLQICSTGNSRVDGAIMCPACGKIHGRCIESMYPFLSMSKLTGDMYWIDAAERLFQWSENTVSLPNGGYLNDIDSDWKGISIFIAIMFLDCLENHSDIISDDFKGKIEKRLKKLSLFLYEYEDIKSKNTNYPASNAYALYRMGKYFNDNKLIVKAAEYEEIIRNVFTSEGLIYGEGWDREKRSKKDLLAIDIGYNVEETLPAIVKLGIIKQDYSLIELAVDSFRKHLVFMLEDGAWDNSFGTRNFKWTYWGSRTSDGVAEALLLLSQYDKSFVKAALKNLKLMEKCTFSGLLAGGPDYHLSNQPVCIHHSFTHAKIIASILDNKLYKGVIENEETEFPRYKVLDSLYISDLDTFIINKASYTATVTAYDWPYMAGGHCSGGVMSLLHYKKIGPVFVSSMGEYFLKEKNNMQVPYGNILHEPLDMRIETEINGVIFSNRNCGEAVVTKKSDSKFIVRGVLCDKNGNQSVPSIPYQIIYVFDDNYIQIEFSCMKGTIICPIVSRRDEDIIKDDKDNSIRIRKKNDWIIFSRLDNGAISLPYDMQRIFNLVPGFEALKMEIAPTKGKAIIKIRSLMQRYFEISGKTI